MIYVDLIHGLIKMGAVWNVIDVDLNLSSRNNYSMYSNIEKKFVRTSVINTIYSYNQSYDFEIFVLIMNEFENLGMDFYADESDVYDGN